MALKKLMLWAITGPLLLWAALMLHVIYHHAYTKPGPLPNSQWPAHIKPDMKEAIIANRKYILEDMKNLFDNKMEVKKFMASRTTSDFVWEDPLQKIEGVEDVTMFFGLIKYFGAVEFKTFQEVHSAHEIIMDWELTIILPKSVGSLKFGLPMRTHLMLEPAEKAGSAEKLFNVYEEWGGNVLLTAKTVGVPYLGLVHSMLRKFFGSLVVWPVKQGLL